MFKTQNTKSLVMVAAVGAALIANLACGKNDKASDLDLATVEKVEHSPEVAQEQYQRIVDQQQAGVVNSQVNIVGGALGSTTQQIQQPEQNQDSSFGMFHGMEDLFDSLPAVFGPKGAAFGAFGKAIWKIIVANRPVLNVRSNRLAYLPQDTQSWDRMSGWSDPIVRSYSVTLKNLYGMQVVKYDYLVAFNYGGSLDGKGKYLQNISVYHTNAEVMWGYSLDSEFVASDVVNHGTAENPVPGVTAEVKWKVSTILKARSVSDPYSIRGDGGFRSLARREL